MDDRFEDIFSDESLEIPALVRKMNRGNLHRALWFFQYKMSKEGPGIKGVVADRVNQLKAEINLRSDMLRCCDQALEVTSNLDEEDSP
jgi:hypothetical protein